jgi:hypothetical protein
MLLHSALKDTSGTVIPARQLRLHLPYLITFRAGRNELIVKIYPNDETAVLALWRLISPFSSDSHQPVEYLKLAKIEDIDSDEEVMVVSWTAPLDGDRLMVCAYTDVEETTGYQYRTSMIFALETNSPLALHWNSEPIDGVAHTAYYLPALDVVIVVGEQTKWNEGTSTFLLVLHPETGKTRRKDLLPYRGSEQPKSANDVDVIAIIFDNGEVHLLPVDLFVKHGFCLEDGKISLVGTDTAKFELPEGW